MVQVFCCDMHVTLVCCVSVGAAAWFVLTATLSSVVPKSCPLAAGPLLSGLVSFSGVCALSSCAGFGISSFLFVDEKDDS